MIEARTPDGATHQFPDGTPDAVIDKVVQSYIASNKQPAPAPAYTDVSGEFGPPTPADPAAQTPDFGRSFGLGVRNVVEGAAGPLYDLAAKPFQAAGLPVRSMSENLSALGLPQAQTPGERTAEAIIGPIASTLTTRGVGSAMQGAANPTVQAVGQALTAQPGVQAAAAGIGGATEAATGSPTAGLAASMAVPLVTGGTSAAWRAVRGQSGGASPADAALGRLAKDKYGIPIDAPDLTNNSMYRIGADQLSRMPFSGAAPKIAAKQSAWQGAIANEMGEPGAAAFTSDVMANTKARLGQGYNDVAATTSIPPSETAKMLNDLGRVLPLARRNLGSQQLQPLEAELRHISELVGRGNGTLSGDAYLAITHSDAPLALSERNTEASVAKYAGMIRDAVDDAFTRFASPENQAKLPQLNYQYRIMRTIDPLVAGSRDGNITPEAFKQKVLTASRRFDAPTGGIAYTGGGNVGELMRIGNMMRAAPQTGTADRAAANRVVAAAIGGGALGSYLNPSLLLTVPATLGANRLGQSYLRSEGLANRLIESSLNPVAAPQNPLLTSGVVGAQRKLYDQRND